LILYLDTSSLVKLYVEEKGSPAIGQLVGEASLVCTSVVGYAEARSSLARHCREGGLTAEVHALAKADLDSEWPNYLSLDVT
jgi:uncharacterized protein with PIN domain